MTREEMLDGLYEIKNWKCNGDAKTHEVVIEAIKALEQEPCEDCISIKDAINAIYGLHTGGKEAVEQESVFDHYSEALHDAVYAIEELPSVKPTRAKGKWIRQTDINSKLYGWYKCSECGAIIGVLANFCSECGTYMRGDEE